MSFNDFCSNYKLLPSKTIKIFGVGRGAFYVYEVFKNFGFTDFCFYVSDLQLVNKVRFLVIGSRFEDYMSSKSVIMKILFFVHSLIQ